MAQQEQPPCRFKCVILYKDQSLGVGAYGKVCKAECDELLCAAKIIHETLLHPGQERQLLSKEKKRLPMTRFEQECELLSTIKHPNIVQYLGTVSDPETKLPVLLMELMDTNLTQFLENSPAILYHVQIGVCHDILLAISFLHHNNIIHRDLSSNNVLLIGRVRAKVTDFGMARLIQDNHQATQLTFTKCPGTDVYMPPEAVQEKPNYTEKIDCFSFGVIAVQILTQKFPDPGVRYVKVNDCRYPNTLKMDIKEVDRRQNHIKQIDPNHPLLPIALDCLLDNDVERPSAQELCKRVAYLKNQPLFTESSSKDINISAQVSNPCGDAMTALRQDTQQISHLKKIIAWKDKEIEDGLLEIRKLKQDLEEEKNKHDQHCVFENTSPKIDNTPQNCHTQSNSYNGSVSKAGFELKWKECESAPCEMVRWEDAVVHHNLVYFKCSLTIYVYNAILKCWSQLTRDCPRDGCPIAIINDLLTTIGGFRGTNELFSLTGEGSNMAWIQEFPPMPTKRCWSTALCLGKALVVAGGRWRRAVLKVVEVMNTETYQWSTATNLPEPIHFFSAAVSGDNIYYLGGENEDHKPSRAVYSCSIDALIHNSIQRGQHTRVFSIPQSHKPTKTDIWRKVADLPVTECTSLSFHGKIIAVGGRDAHCKPSTAVHVYDPETDSWTVTSHMAIGRYYCFAAALPDSHLMVVGGYAATTETTEMATLVT